MHYEVVFWQTDIHKHFMSNKWKRNHVTIKHKNTMNQSETLTALALATDLIRFVFVMLIVS